MKWRGCENESLFDFKCYSETFGHHLWSQEATYFFSPNGSSLVCLKFISNKMSLSPEIYDDQNLVCMTLPSLISAAAAGDI